MYKCKFVCKINTKKTLKKSRNARVWKINSFTLKYTYKYVFGENWRILNFEENFENWKKIIV